MGYEHCFAVGAVGGDVAVDVREVVVLGGGHLPGVLGTFGMRDEISIEQCVGQRQVESDCHIDDCRVLPIILPHHNGIMLKEIMRKY